jgi:hypothetical protein
VLLLILSNAVQNSMNAGDNSLIGGMVSASTLETDGSITVVLRRRDSENDGDPPV